LLAVPKVADRCIEVFDLRPVMVQEKHKLIAAVLWVWTFDYTKLGQGELFHFSYRGLERKARLSWRTGGGVDDSDVNGLVGLVHASGSFLNNIGEEK
jgi:hypothetical protein